MPRRINPVATKITFALLFSSLVFLIALKWYFGTRSAEIIIGIIDTGIDLKKAPELQAKLAGNAGEFPGNGKDDDGNGYVDDVLSWNFYGANPEITDEAGHGTAVAKRIAAQCEKCQILPIRIARHGAGIRAEDIAGAIQYGVQRGARVLNISFGVTESSPTLQQAVEAATSRGVVLIAAAGQGLPNPFRPSRLEEVFPQAYPEVIVVGTAEKADTPDMLQNYGPALDLVLLDPPSGPESGSSFTAAEISGRAAALLHHQPKLYPAEVRQKLRAATTAPGKDDPSRMGFGIFDATAWEKAKLDPLTLRLSPSGELDFNAPREIKMAGAAWKCDAADPAFPLQANTKKKGRALLAMGPPSSSKCSIKARVQLDDGTELEQVLTP